MLESKNKRALESIKALLMADGIGFLDTDRAIKSLSETCLPTALTKIYLKEVGSIMAKNETN